MFEFIIYPQFLKYLKTTVKKQIVKISIPFSLHPQILVCKFSDFFLCFLRHIQT